MLLISRSKDLWKILMFNWWTVISIFFDFQLPPLAPNIFSCFSNHLGAVFFRYHFLIQWNLRLLHTCYHFLLSSQCIKAFMLADHWIIVIIMGARAWPRWALAFPSHSFVFCTLFFSSFSSMSPNIPPLHQPISALVNHSSVFPPGSH